MSIEMKPETERLIQDELRKGHFSSVDEIIIEGVHARRGKQSGESASASRLSLSEFLLSSPLAGAELDLERDNDTGRRVEL